MSPRKKPAVKYSTPFEKKAVQDRSSKLWLLVDNHLVQFLVSLLLIVFFTQSANGFNHIYPKLIFKTIGYGVFYYLSTPFTIYWLAYVSSLKLTKVKLGITIFLVSIYSFIFWDSYFFYKDTLAELLFYQW